MAGCEKHVWTNSICGLCGANREEIRNRWRVVGLQIIDGEGEAVAECASMEIAEHMVELWLDAHPPKQESVN